MGRGLPSLGFFLVLATVALWLGGAAGWVSQGFADTASSISLKAALVVLSASLLLRVVSAVTSRIAKRRCAVCGAPVERGHIYCLDHLQATVNSFRDRAHESTVSRPSRRV